MALRDVKGQKRAVQMLQGILRRGRIASSYLFSGEPGVGKKMAALNFAKAINCASAPHAADGAQDEPGMFSPDIFPGGPPVAGTFDACDACDSCAKTAAGGHPDVIVVSPEDRQIRIEEIRVVDEALSFRPFEGRMKVVIVDDAELMNISAANAFLKTLEEPPAHSVVILISSRPDLLPATIRSRCSRINFVPLPAGSCREVLQGRVAVQEVELALRLSLGRPGLALTADLKEERDRVMDLFRGMLRADKDAWASREDMERWFDGLLVLLRDMATYKIRGGPAGLINSDLEGDVARLTQSLDLKAIIYIHKECSRLRGLLMFNLNKSVTWNYVASLLRKEMAA